MTFPVKLYHPANPKKTLTAGNQAELDGLLRIGWKIKE